MVRPQTLNEFSANDDSLWYGTFIDRNNSALKDKLPEIRRLILAGDISRAEELIMKYMAGTPAGMRHYTLLGVLNIAMNQHLPFVMGWLPKSESAEEYELNLDLMAGVLDVKHKAAGVSYQRRMFISHPAQVMCIRYTCDSPGAINMDMFRTGLVSPMPR